VTWRKPALSKVEGFSTCALLLLLPATLAYAAGAPRDPSDYAARQRLVNTSRQAGDYASALYHAAWLAWLAPRSYADRAEAVLRERQVQDRARRVAQQGPTAAILAALGARRARAEACLSGKVKSQALLRQNRITDLLQAAEAAQARTGEPDPVVRMALADLCLALDDVIALRGDASAKERRPILLKAISLTEAVTQALPDAPGAYRTLTLARARLAELENDPDTWDLAITACAHALTPDPDDQALREIMWGLHLRAGHWDEARRWEKRVESTGK
jgi:hypothetical protein